MKAYAICLRKQDFNKITEVHKDPQDKAQA